jgi:antitoxin HigA-1
MGIPLNRLNEVVRGRRGVTADTALRLARLLDTSPEFWMNLQTAVDLFRASKVAETRAQYSTRPKTSG